MATMNDFPLARRLTNVVRSYAIYLWKTVWPAALAVIDGISFAVWWCRRTAPISIAPNIGFIQAGPQPYADRFTYLPSILPLAAIAVFLSGKLGEKPIALLATALATVLAFVSWRQIGVWRDDLTLYRHSIAAAPGASLIYMNLGLALQKMGRFNEAIANYQIAPVE